MNEHPSYEQQQQQQVEISVEHPLRPPRFSLSLVVGSSPADQRSSAEWFNELRAMEAEVSPCFGRI